MPEGPTALGIHLGVEVRMACIQQLLRPEAVKPQQPVRLIQAVLSPEGRKEALRCGQQGAVGHGHIGGIEHPLQLILVVKGLGEGEDVPVALRGGSYDHLGGLPRRGEAGSPAGQAKLLPGDGDAVPDLGHRGQNGLFALVWGQQGQAALAGQLDVHGQAVGQQAQLPGEQGGRPGNGFGVDVAAEAVLLPQQPQGGDHPLGGVVGADKDGGGKK